MTVQPVSADWQANFAQDLAIRAGEPLHLGRTDPDNPGWRWAENAAGLGGGLPEALIAGNHMTEGFDSM